MTLHRIADELLEIRRYVRSNPEHVKKELRSLCGLTWHLPNSDDEARIDENIQAALARIASNPEILEGYLYGAAAEIRELAFKQEDAA